MAQSIVIGGASGFWGDSFTAVPQLLRSRRLNYLVFDYLAEVTMSILSRARAADPRLGYAVDFVDEVMKQNLPEIARQGIKVISNAGGTNPLECARALQKVVDDAGLALKVAAVTGDDLMPQIDRYRAAGVKEMFSGEAFPDRAMSANAYLGAFPIARALQEGADIVVTGRVVDSAVTLAAGIHAHGWQPADLDALAGGSLAGHILECGAQGSGGLFTDWREVPRWDDIGYPMVELAADGSFVVTKAEGTGGLVSCASVGEQLVYEIGDPARYLLPDVSCDFTQVRMEQVGPDRVRVSGTKGRPPTDTLKVSLTYAEGYRLSWYLTIVGIDADAKAQRTAEAVFARCSRMLRESGLPDFTETSFEVLGAEAAYGAGRRSGPVREVVLKLAAKHASARGLSLLLREATSSGTSMSPGTCGVGGHRPKPMPLVRLFSFLAPKSDVLPVVSMEGRTLDVPFVPGVRGEAPARPAPDVFAAPPAADDLVEVPLVALAWGRSGDKGDKANIGILARRPEYLPWIAASLTPQRVKDCFAHWVKGRVERFALPGLNGMNFLLHEALAGGGMTSLRNDYLAKTFAQILLDQPVAVPAAMAGRVGAAANGEAV